MLNKCKICESIYKGKECPHCHNRFFCNSCRNFFPKELEDKEFRNNCIDCAKKISQVKGIEYKYFIPDKIHGREVICKIDEQLIRVIKIGNKENITSFKT